MRPPPRAPVTGFDASCTSIGIDASGGLEWIGCPLFGQFFDALPLAAAVVDRGDRIVRANPEFCRAFGFAVESLLCRPLNEAIVPDFLRAEALSQARSATYGTGSSVETLCRRHDGSLVEVRLRRVPLWFGAAVAGQVAIFEDLGERRRGEAERHEWITRHRQADGDMLEADRRAGAIASARALFTGDGRLDERLSGLPRLLVPELADSCIVYLIDDAGRVHRLGFAFGDRTQEELLREQLENYPTTRCPLIPPIARVLRTGEAELIPEVSIGALKAVPGDREHVSIALLVGLTSLMVVPLAVAGRTVGAISLGIADSGRRFQAEDLLALEEIARFASDRLAQERRVHRS